MTIQRKAFSAQTSTLAEKRQVRVTCSTPEVDRAGDVVVQEGIDLTSYKTNPVVLWMHDPEQPIARCVEIGVVGGALTALVQFPPEGDDPEADLIYNRVKNGVINAVSIGFMGKTVEPLDPQNPPRFDANGCNLGGGFKFVASELAELSFVSVPAARGALVLERSATVSISATELAGLRAAAALPKKLAGEFRAIAKSAPKGQRGQILRLANIAEKSAGGAVVKVAAPLTAKGLWHVGYLASTLAELGWIHDSVESEAEWSGDETAVPGMLADALRQIGAALITLTQEEVADLLAELAGDDGETGMWCCGSCSTWCCTPCCPQCGAACPVAGSGGMEAMAAPSLSIKDVIGALKGKPIPGLSIKAGRVLSAANEDALTQARDLIDGVVKQVASENDDLETRAAEIRAMEIKAMEAVVAA